MKAGHICTCKSFVPWKLECNVNKVRGLFYSFFFLQTVMWGHAAKRCDRTLVAVEMKPCCWHQWLCGLALGATGQPALGALLLGCSCPSGAQRGVVE